MPTTSFRIGDVFPADEPVARFVTVVAMISNDWQRLAKQMLVLEDVQDEDEEELSALLISNYRLQASLHVEAARFLNRAHTNFPDVREFIDALPSEAKDRFKLVVDGIKPKSPRYHGKWLSEARNLTFHYAEINQRKHVGRALQSAAAKTGTITAGRTVQSVRFGFADTVALEWLGAPQPTTDEKRMAALSESVTAMTLFAQQAMRIYLDLKGVRLASG
jgi:hypothetical protein